MQLQFAPLLEDHGFPLAIMGMLLVFGALVLVSVFIAVLPRFTDLLATWFPDRELAAVPTAKRDELPEDILVVLAATAMEVLDRPYRIVHIESRASEELSWSLEGRRQHHASHKTR